MDVPLKFKRQKEDEMVGEAESFYHRLQSRRTVREFASDPVPADVIRHAILSAGTAPSGANMQPWHFAVTTDPVLKRKVRIEAEKEEQAFYDGGGGDEWLSALEPIGTGPHKPHLEDAPWLIVVFAQRWGVFDDGSRFKNYYVPESVGISCGFLISALHQAGLSILTHTPNPMKFLNEALGRPKSEKPVMIMAVGHAAENATVPEVAKIKKPLNEILKIYD